MSQKKRIHNEILNISVKLNPNCTSFWHDLVLSICSISTKFHEFMSKTDATRRFAMHEITQWCGQAWLYCCTDSMHWRLSYSNGLTPHCMLQHSVLNFCLLLALKRAVCLFWPTFGAQNDCPLLWYMPLVDRATAALHFQWSLGQTLPIPPQAFLANVQHPVCTFCKLAAAAHLTLYSQLD